MVGYGKQRDSSWCPTSQTLLTCPAVLEQCPDIVAA